MTAKVQRVCYKGSCRVVGIVILRSGPEQALEKVCIYPFMYIVYYLASFGDYMHMGIIDGCWENESLYGRELATLKKQ